MEEIVLLDAVERYLDGEMTAQEKSFFEELRRTNSDVDQLVVEHQLFLSQMNNYGGRKELKTVLNDTHSRLVEDGTIVQNQPAIGGSKVVRLWVKHRRTVAVAASIACVTALTISGILSYLSPKDQAAANKIEILNNKVTAIEKAQKTQSNWIREIEGNIVKTPEGMQQSSAGTSFLIDAKGYLVTNSHVINNASALRVVNNGKEYIAKTVYDDPATDLAILKIEDSDYFSAGTIPYAIRKTGVELGEEIFTLGYPRSEIVYGKGYLSAQSGFQDDSMSVQISVTANPGNSGGPVLDKNGDVVGILNSREKNADGVVFANKAGNISKLLDKLKDQDTTYRSVKLPVNNTIKGKERTQQIKQLRECVFMVKAYTK